MHSGRPEATDYGEADSVSQGASRSDGEKVRFRPCAAPAPHLHTNPVVKVEYQGKVEVLTPYFGSSGTGQINAVFPV